MKQLVKTMALTGLLSSSLPAFADLYYFSYTFGGETPFGATGTPGNQLTAVVDGTLLGDGDTIVINSFESATLGGFDYAINQDIGFRGHVSGTLPTMSLSGAVLDMWVCVQGFSDTSPNGGDCPFGNEGGFLLNNNAGDLGLVNFSFLSGNPEVEQTIAWAGIPDLFTPAPNNPNNNRYREGDIPLKPENWFATAIATDLEPVAAEAVGEVLQDCSSASSVTSCATGGLNDLRNAGVITGREKGAIQSSLARSSNGKGKKK